MGSLSNLYISQSFISLLHLASNNTASSTSTEIQDGLGNGIGITVNTDGDVTLAGTLGLRNGLDISGSVTINTAVTSSTPTYVNSGNYFTDSIIRITGSFASGSAASPTVNEVQIGWPVYGNGLVSGAVVTDKQYVNSQFVELTINQNTAVWFGNYYFTNPSVQYYNFSVSGSEDITGSLWVRDDISVNDISASGNISASNLYVKGRISAYELDVTIESSSIIFTSGSNILGDEANIDTQTLIGRVIVSGSLEVTGSTRINGNTTITGSTTISGSITASGNISSSTLSGVGNVTLYSTSVDSRINTTSASLALFSGSQYKTDSASFQSQITTNSASFAAYSSSLVATFATNAYVNLYTASANGRLDSLEAKTGSYATTGSNTFIGNEIFSGSVRGNVLPLTITSNTASMNCSLGNFFTLTLPTGSNTFLSASNINPGQTISLKITQILNGTLTYLTGSIKFPLNNEYTASVGYSNTTDILTFVSYDTSSLFAVAVKTLQ